MTRIDLLKSINFGESVAEYETTMLKSYFVRTDQWKKISAGEIDIVYGSKGSGKSAMYSVLVSMEGELFDKSILIVSAENPRGVSTFKNLEVDPPTSEAEFINLWKVYFLLIIGYQIKDYALPDETSKKLVNKLEECGLLPRKKTLAAFFKNAFDYVKGLRKLESLQPGLSIGHDGNITGFTFKISFAQPSEKEVREGYISIDELFEEVNKAMVANRLKLWIILDRLDVAFSENSTLESNALRALFRVYLSLIGHESIQVKIFIRDDIWKNITTDGFREASHITRTTTIEWNRENLLHLVINRLMKNEQLVRHYECDVSDILKDIDKQTKIFYQMFPSEIAKEDRCKTFDWILTRTRDAKGNDSPREIIQLLNEAIKQEISSLEIGNNYAQGKQLISINSLKKALAIVSKTKIESVVFAEYPGLKWAISALINEKSMIPVDELSRLWDRNRRNAKKIANELVEIGFLARKGSKDKPTYEIPFIYRPYLNMT
jgi:hypothetical protein